MHATRYTANQTMQIPPTKIQKYTYHANDGFPPEFQYPAIETYTHVVDDNVTQCISSEHASSPYYCGMSFR